MINLRSVIVFLLAVVSFEARAEGPFGPVVKLTSAQQKAVESGVKKQLYYPDKATVSKLSAQMAKKGIVVCGYLDAPGDYHPWESRRAFFGSFGDKGGSTFNVFGRGDYFTCTIVESMCRSSSLL